MAIITSRSYRKQMAIRNGELRERFTSFLPGMVEGMD